MQLIGHTYLREIFRTLGPIILVIGILMGFGFLMADYPRVSAWSFVIAFQVFSIYCSTRFMVSVALLELVDDELLVEQSPQS